MRHSRCFAALRMTVRLNFANRALCPSSFPKFIEAFVGLRAEATVILSRGDGEGSQNASLEVLRCAQDDGAPELRQSSTLSFILSKVHRSVRWPEGRSDRHPEPRRRRRISNCVTRGPS